MLSPTKGSKLFVPNIPKADKVTTSIPINGEISIDLESFLKIENNRIKK